MQLDFRIMFQHVYMNNEIQQSTKHLLYKRLIQVDEHTFLCII